MFLYVPPKTRTTYPFGLNPLHAKHYQFNKMYNKDIDEYVISLAKHIATLARVHAVRRQTGRISEYLSVAVSTIYEEQSG